MESPPIIDLESTAGPLFIGIVAAIFLTGIATMQAWNYFRVYSDDRPVFKTTVLVVFIADVIHTLLLLTIAYHYLILSFGDFNAFQHLTPLWPASVFVGSFIALVAQTFSCYRIYYVSGLRVAALGCWLLVLMHMGFSDWLVIKMIESLGDNTIEVISRQLARAPLLTSLTMGTAADISIAGSLCFGMLTLSLTPTASNVSVQHKKVFDRLIAFVVASGLLTSIAALGEMIAYLAMDNLVYLAFYAFTAKIYVNALLASLNERTYLRAEMQLVSDIPKDKLASYEC